MAATQRLELRQSQSLVMTPQLQQAIKLLQLSNLELTAFVERELEQNPLLEPDDGADERPAADQAAGPDAVPEIREGAGEEGARDSMELTQDERFPDTAEAPLDTDFENLYNHGGPNAEAGLMGGAAGADRGGSRDGEGLSFDQLLREEKTLRQHLLDQVQVSIGDPVDRIIAVHIIDMLDEAGYAKGDLDGLAVQLGCGLERVEATLTRLQGFDPTGIFARSLPECLALQLAERDRLDPAMQALLDNLELLTKGERTALRRLCGVDDEDFIEMLAELRALDPKPGQAFDLRPAEPIVPDILLRPLPSGGWFVELNPDSLPRVLVNEDYYRMVSSRTRSKPDRDYLSERFQSANWLVKALHQRAKTILKVASEIVRQQEAFFQKGVDQMKPLTLKDIAESIGMHESTVSRVTSNKYMVTPRGTFELKYFFGSSIAGADGAAHASEAIRHRIKQLIDQESKNRVLSDDSIVTVLRKDGVDIARRTVAKYREAMRIPSSVQRRREKAVRS